MPEVMPIRTCSRPTPGRCRCVKAVDDIQPGPDRAFGLRLVRQRKAEEGDDAIAEYPENITFIPIDTGLAGFLVAAKHDLHGFGIELVGEFGEAHHVAEKHR